MDLMSLLVFLLIGAVAGWLAGTLKRGGGFGFFGNMVIGVTGAFIGGFVFNLLGIAAVGFIGAVIMATVGALLLLYIGSVIRRA